MSSHLIRAAIMVARTSEGRAFRILTVLDKYACMCLSILA